MDSMQIKLPRQPKLGTIMSYDLRYIEFTSPEHAILCFFYADTEYFVSLYCCLGMNFNLRVKMRDLKRTYCPALGAHRDACANWSGISSLHDPQK
jgi:hypothetical protein